MPEFSQSVRVPASPQEAFAWHEREGAFARLQAPWDPVEVLAHEGGIRDGARVRLRVKLFGPLRMKVIFGHREYRQNEGFVDEQIKGPFRAYRHEHRFKALDGGKACELTDHITYKAPPGGDAFVAGKFAKMFAHRHRIFKADMEDLAERGACQPKTVLLTGASGLVGAALTARLKTRGHTVRTLSRTPQPGVQGAFAWDPAKGTLDASALEGVDAVIHLAGAPIAQRWSPAVKQTIMESRTKSTHLLVDRLKEMKSHSVDFICASGINYYGYDQAEAMTEEAPSGDGFLAEVCRAWEGATTALESAGNRVVLVRTGVVLSPEGGMLAKLLPPFKLGLGGPIGRGKRVLSWISIEDLVEVYLRALEDAAVSGPVNAVAPEAVTNQQFTKAFAGVLRRPALFPAPPAALSLVFGDMGRETVLSNLRVEPAFLKDLRFSFRQADLRTALADLLNPHSGKAD